MAVTGRFVYNSRMAQSVLLFPEVGLHIVRCRHLRPTSWGRPNMIAPVWRLYWNTTPGAWIRWQDQLVWLGPDVGVLIAPQTPFAGGHDRPFGHFFMHFVLDHHLRLRSPGVFVRRITARDGRLLCRLSERASGEARANPAELLNASELLIRWLRTVPVDAWQPPVEDPRVQQALLMVQQRLPRAVGNEELAGFAEVDSSTLTRLFRAELGVTPHRYGLRLRLDGACRQLMHTHDAVDEVAQRWGFADRFHLTRAMARELSTTPGRLRRHGI